jgi:glucose-6-phosphate 1-dehydrogenase
MTENSDERTDSQPQFRLFGACQIELLRSFGLIIFGAAGDLSKRKLIPAIYHLFEDGLLPDNFFIFCTDRIKLTTEQYRRLIKNALNAALPSDFKTSQWLKFAKRLYYTPFNYKDTASYRKHLKEKLPSLEKKHATEGNRIFYFAVPPSIVEDIITGLGVNGLSVGEKGYSHIVIEKPFGRNLETARQLNIVLKKFFEEKQIFRIDHYVAKETVQNMLMFRFANSIFEPLWNRRYIDHIQITVSETLGVEHRAGYYEEAGVIRDMFQSHILQLLAVIGMEAPASFRADYVRDEKIKVLRSIRPIPTDNIQEFVAIGQYGKGTVNQKLVAGYRDEPGVHPDSATATYAAMKLFIDNWRWNGVPFYLRSGKRLTVRKTEISIHFKQVPHMMFSNVMENLIEPNVLVFRLQPEEGISLTFQTKKPGTRVCLNPVLMDFSYHKKDVFLDAYEWVLLDCILGDQMLFLQQEGVEQTWSLLTPVIEKIETASESNKFPNYAAASAGPDEARALIEKDGRRWRPLITEKPDEHARILGHRIFKR